MRNLEIVIRYDERELTLNFPDSFLEVIDLARVASLNIALPKAEQLDDIVDVWAHLINSNIVPLIYKLADQKMPIPREISVLEDQLSLAKSVYNLTLRKKVLTEKQDELPTIG